MSTDTSSDAYKLEVVKSALKTLRVESQKREQGLEEQLHRQNARAEKEKAALRATIQRLEDHLERVRSKIGDSGFHEGMPEGPWSPQDDETAEVHHHHHNGRDDDNAAAKLRIQLQSRDATIAALQQETRELRQTLGQKEESIAKLQHQVAGLAAQLEEHGRQRGTHDVKLAKLRQRLQEQAVTSALNQSPDRRAGFGIAPSTAEALKAYHRPGPLLKGYDEFVRLLNEPEAQPLRQTIDSFVNIFLTRMPQENEHDKIHSFINAMENPLKKLRHSRDASQEEIGETMDYLESYILGQDAVYSRVFGGSDDLRYKDMRLSEKMRVLQFIQPQHLDIPPVLRWHPAFALARKEILTINDVRSPQEKMQVIFRAAKLILHVLEDRGGESTSADHFLPVFIYTILKAQVPFLETNIDYISKFRHPDRLGGEQAYYFTQFMSVAQFLHSSGPSVFSIDPEFYARMIEMRRRRRNSDPGPLREQQQWCSLHASEWSAAYPLM